MDQNTMLMLGVVKIQNPTTKQIEILEARGFDVLAFFFPFFRYAFAGMWSKSFIAILVSITVIGYPIMAWMTGFNFRKYRLEHYLQSGWKIITEEKASQAC